MRHGRTCLRYPGGKFYGVKHIRQFYNTPHNEYREVFLGGGSVFLDKPKLDKNNWLNDIDSELINFYKIIKSPASRKRLYALIDGEVATKERHAEVKEMTPKNNVERAFKYFYLNRTSFSGIMNKPRWGYAIGSSVTPDRWVDIIDPVAQKLAGTELTSVDFREMIEKPSDNEVLLYLDPPYYKASKAIYNNEFSEEDHIDLMKLLKKTKFKFILSYENSPEIRELYKWANIHEISFRYYMSEARRQDGNELIITNF